MFKKNIFVKKLPITNKETFLESIFQLKDRILRDIKNLYEHEEENYYKPVRVNKFWSKNYTKYESNGDINKALSVEEHLNKISPYLRDIINNLKKSDTQKHQLTIANKFISSIDNEEEGVMH